MMGTVWTRLRKAPKTSREILEKLDEDVKSLSKWRVRNQQYERSFVGYLLVLSFLLYLVCLAVFYVYFLPPRDWGEGLLHSLPLLLFPLVVFLLKKLLNIYFTQRISQCELQLRALHEERRKVLNEVMERETYRTAVELLRQYDPGHPALQQQPPPATPAAAPSSQQTVRQRRGTPHPSTLITPRLPPSQQQPAPVLLQSTPVRPVLSASQRDIPPGMCVGPAPGPPMPCPILPRERSTVDKFVEYLVGDGPSNRYALICVQCHSHNGMALRDDFEFLSFRCAYCYHVNQARKSRPSLQPDATPDHVTSGDQAEDSTTAPTTSTPSQQTEEPLSDQQQQEQEQEEGGGGD